MGGLARPLLFLGRVFLNPAASLPIDRFALGPRCVGEAERPPLTGRVLALCDQQGELIFVRTSALDLTA